MMKNLFLIISFLTLSISASSQSRIKKENVKVRKIDGQLNVSMRLVVDEGRVKSNGQMFITPVLVSKDSTHVAQFPTVAVSGRNMHYLYKRGIKAPALKNEDYNVIEEIWHKAGKADTINYMQSTALKSWMNDEDNTLLVVFDTCGCGIRKNKDADPIPVDLNPAKHMHILPYPRPVPEIDKIVKHEGKAKVQFEVDKFELHDKVYSYTHRITKRRHTIDNRAELQTIDDSIRYALTSPNVELVKLEVCGYASPESPYDHNEYLALNRSKAVMLYLEKHEGVPDSVCSYSAVPENWAGFREQTLAAKDITEQQRTDLLALIDRPVHTSGDYDRKEDELKKSAKFAQLYSSKIHPDWFPELRYTQFAIYTHLKPATIEQLREIIKTEPQRMSLNQMYRVAATYEHGSKEFHEVMATALRYFPKDPAALINAASIAIEDRNYELAESYIKNVGDQDEANVIRGIIETHKGNYDAARALFQKASGCPEAQRNLKMLEGY